MSRKIKGLFLIHLPPPTHGVSIINSWILASEKIGSFISIDSVDLATARSISDIGKQGFHKYIKLFKIYLNTLYKLVFNKYDFVYITLSPIGVAFLKDSLLILFSRFFSADVLIHLHGKGISQKIESSSNWLLRYYNFVFKNSYVIHLADSLVSDLRFIKSYSEISILNNGIPVFESLPKNKSTKISILHLSNLIESKGSYTILEAANELVKKGIEDFEINYVGSWDNEDYKKRFLTYININKLGNHVNIKGPLYGNDKIDILANSDIFVLPSYNDSYPLTILEAFQAGLPVISTYEGAIPEIIQDGMNGFLVESKNKFELAGKMKLLIESESLRKEMSQKAVEAYNTKYTFSIFENNFLNIIKKATS